jgi:dipeptidyl aminopeptidase/acylaminoacyl peptidase
MGSIFVKRSITALLEQASSTTSKEQEFISATGQMWTPSRIGLWGGSYGGYLTALGLARASDLFAAGVDMHGVHDWKGTILNFAPSYNPDSDTTRLAWESSPLSSIKTWHSPVLLVQGDDDRNVPFAQMVDLIEALRKQGVEFEQLVFPDEIHEFLLHRSWIAAYSAAADFLDRHLGRVDASSVTSRH